MSRADRVEIADRVTPFAEAVLGDEAPVEEVALLVSKALYPSLDLIDALADLDALAAACPTPTRDGVMEHLFGEGSPHRLIGDTDDYHGWRNSCVDQVVARRRGMPITLAVVGIAVARRVGVDLVGIGMPGHFLIGDARDGTWFADPFRGVTGIDRAGCRVLAMSMGVTRWQARYLEPVSTRHIVARVLNNLKSTCARRGDDVKLAIVMQLRQALPEFAGEAEAARRALTVLN